MRNRSLILTMLLLLFSLSTLAQNTPYHLKLLAVQENGGNYTGSDADLYLELIPGSGRVFLETYPLTKMDTQISTRFAKQIACSHFKLHCEKYDFIYTIKAKSNIIGGPSAGAAIAALTTIAVKDLSYQEDITITGTINSGGIIGPVGGVKQKLEAASQAGLKEVLIAQGASQDLVSNETSAELIAYAQENLSLKVEEVADLDEVLLHLTGKNLSTGKPTILENSAYTKIMHSLQQVLCARTDKIKKDLAEDDFNATKELEESVEQKQQSAENASQQGDYYSAASFCFGNNINLKTEFYDQKNISRQSYARLLELVERKNTALEIRLDQEEIATISDLQAYSIVKERIKEVQQQLEKFRSKEIKPMEWAYTLAYAEERYFSAVSWMQFFEMDGQKFSLNREVLQTSCQEKISESEERQQYAALFLGDQPLQSIDEKINVAKEALKQEEYTLCLITAAQAKAEANAILSTMGVSEENFPLFLESKKRAVEKVIAENSAEGIFPILGYSYYEYAAAFQEGEQKYTALLYLEYALELSDLQIYFPEEKSYLQQQWGRIYLSSKAAYFISGVLCGGVLVVVLGMLLRKKKHHH